MAPTPPSEFNASKPLQILIVDDHGVVRDGLSSLLSQEPDFQIVDSDSTDDDIPM